MGRALHIADAVRTAGGIAGDALVVDGGQVAARGQAAALRAGGLEEIHHRGVIVPGLIDAHFHPGTYTASLLQPSLKDAADLAEVGERLRDAGDRQDPGSAVVGLRLDDETLAEARLPTRHDLDTLLGDRPALVHRYCGHVAVANTAALELAGIGAATADPAGGSLDRDDGGVPNGVLRETAVTLVAGALADRYGSTITPTQLARAMRGLAGLGLTGLGAIIGCGDSTWAELGDEVEILAEAAADIPIRLNVLVIAHSPAQLEAAARRLDGAGPTIGFLGLKAFADGSLGGHTAAMHRPFADRPGERGTVRLDRAWAMEMTRHALSIADRVAVHAIGDRANALVLDVFAENIAAGADPARLRVEHASVLGPAEVERFAALGVTASVQPAFIASETGWLEKRVGPERLSLTYPWRTLWDRGVPLAGGSDCPVEPPDPMWGMAAARDRCGVVPEQGLTGPEALALFTTGAAAAIAAPEPLAVGSPADFVVLDRDPVSSSPDELRDAAVLATYVGGGMITVDRELVTWQG